MHVSQEIVVAFIFGISFVEKQTTTPKLQPVKHRGNFHDKTVCCMHFWSKRKAWKPPNNFPFKAKGHIGSRQRHTLTFYNRKSTTVVALNAHVQRALMRSAW